MQALFRAAGGPLKESTAKRQYDAIENHIIGLKMEMMLLDLVCTGTVDVLIDRHGKLGYRAVAALSVKKGPAKVVRHR